MNYAKNTKINGERSEQEIKKLLKTFGAANILPIDNLIVGEKTFIGVMFEFNNRRVKITVEVPDPHADKFRLSPNRNLVRSAAQCQQFYVKEIDRLWRALVFKIKARLVSIEENISDFEEEFFYDLVVPGSDGQTVGDVMRPQLNQAYLTGKLPPLLPGIGETEKE